MAKRWFISISSNLRLLIYPIFSKGHAKKFACNIYNSSMDRSINGFVKLGVAYLIQNGDTDMLCPCKKCEYGYLHDLFDGKVLVCLLRHCFMLGYTRRIKHGEEGVLISTAKGWYQGEAQNPFDEEALERRKRWRGTRTWRGSSGWTWSVFDAGDVVSYNAEGPSCQKSATTSYGVLALWGFSTTISRLSTTTSFLGSDEGGAVMAVSSTRFSACSRR